MSKFNFFLDIDGTILGKGQDFPSDAVCDALRLARSNGCKVFINTGRTLSYIPDQIKKSGLFDGFCCGCGTFIQYDGNTVFEKYLSKETLIRITDAFFDLKLSADLIFEGRDEMFFIGEPQEWFDKHGFLRVTSSDFFRKNTNLPPINKFSLHNNDRQREEFLNMLRDEFKVMILPGYVECVPLGCDKGNAIMLTEQKLNLDHRLSVAVGDSMNDFEMLKYAGISVAMGNSPTEVKNICDIVTENCENDGVAVIINKLLNDDSFSYLFEKK